MFLYVFCCVSGVFWAYAPWGVMFLFLANLRTRIGTPGKGFSRDTWWFCKRLPKLHLVVKLTLICTQRLFKPSEIFPYVCKNSQRNLQRRWTSKNLAKNLARTFQRLSNQPPSAVGPISTEGHVIQLRLVRLVRALPEGFLLRTMLEPLVQEQGKVFIFIRFFLVF